VRPNPPFDLRLRDKERRDHHHRGWVFERVDVYEMQFGLKPGKPWNRGDERRIRRGRKISWHEQTPNSQ